MQLIYKKYYLVLSKMLSGIQNNIILVLKRDQTYKQKENKNNIIK